MPAMLDIREIYRFPNDPVRYGGELHWDVLRLWHEMNKALESSSLPKLESIGIDTWGVDYALLGERGNLIENPYHYRDARTEGIMDSGVCANTARKHLFYYRHSVPPVQHLVSALCSLSSRLPG